MPILLGVDEAGYGPNYGPLCVAASAWQVAEGEPSGFRAQGSKLNGQGRTIKRAAERTPAEDGLPDLYRLLRKAVARTPDKAGRKIAIADSKALYSPGAGLRQLERGVLAALLAIGDDATSDTAHGGQPLPGRTPRCINRVSELLAATGADPHGRRGELACHAGDEQVLPIGSPAEEICRLAALLRKTCTDNGTVLLALRARLVYPAEFNELVDHFGSKGAALSHVTLQLVREAIDLAALPASSALPTAAAAQRAAGAAPYATRVFVCLDKHGGRNRYAGLLQHHFPESWIEPIAENRNRSRYRWMYGATPIEAVFRVGCEELLPTALASMAAKYHRELAMRAFNSFWTARLPELRPTAGYPNDSHRFRAAIAAAQSELGIADRLVWRNR
ncbi:MAG: hypothetical protein DCC67_08435 [Planctomycetota bacterium]|nr:MAG: hypothetical protein DCC67_08435 [Planctomycetota bacterium]